MKKTLFLFISLSCLTLVSCSKTTIVDVNLDDQFLTKISITDMSNKVLMTLDNSKLFATNKVKYTSVNLKSNSKYIVKWSTQCVDTLHPQISAYNITSYLMIPCDKIDTIDTKDYNKIVYCFGPDSKLVIQSTLARQ